MEFILRLLDKLFGGIYKMSNTEKNKNDLESIEKNVNENYKEILSKEEDKRNIINEKAKYVSKIIEQDVHNYKEQLDNKSELKNQQYNLIDEDLDKAINEGDIENIKILTQKLEEINE